MGPSRILSWIKAIETHQYEAWGTSDRSHPAYTLGCGGADENIALVKRQINPRILCGLNACIRYSLKRASRAGDIAKLSAGLIDGKAQVSINIASY